MRRLWALTEAVLPDMGLQLSEKKPKRSIDDFFAQQIAKGRRG